jgi:polyisoprenyl-teichoic acid--peptidoglycan teichoic acid transferase
MTPPSLRGALDDPPVPSAAPEQPSSGRSRRTWRQRTLIGTGIVVVLAIVASVGAVAYSEWRFSQVHKEKLKLAAPVSGVPQNYLIVGSDSRSVIAKNDPDKAVFEGGTDATGGQRSDTIMVVRIDAAKKSAKLLSFPRDLWVPIWGTGASQRINTAYNNGPQPLINTIEQDFGIPINHYVEVNFDSFRDVVNAIGGVPLYFSTRMRDENSGLDIETPGCVTLNGDQALSFARSRELEYYDTALGRWKYDGTGDLGRITRQQIFIRTLIGRAESKATGLNLITTNNLVQSVVKNLKVDSSFSLTDILSLLGDYKYFDANKLVTYTLPTTPYVTAGGADVLHLQTAAAQPMLDAFRPASQQSTNIKPSQVTLAVNNGGGISGEASRTSAKLISYGFNISTTGNASATSVTTVYYGTGGQDQAQLVASYVDGGGATVSADSTLAAGAVELVIGSDFTGIAHTTSTATASGSTSTSGGGTTTTTAPPIGLQAGSPPPGVKC